MSWPFVYHSDDRLSAAELRSARLDGLVVELGDAFIPADAVETPELRAASLSVLVGSDMALTHESAAWVHGALLRLPARHRVQRIVSHRLPHVIDARLEYRDARIPSRDLACLSGVHLTHPIRTLDDAVRDLVSGRTDAAEVVAALCRWRPQLVEETIQWLRTCQQLRHKRTARAWLEQYARELPAQLEVVR
ncbi:SAM-dependent methyltransferase [Microbacterium sp.]|uniref:SAM-dependent methyltransferase n=1 Tax=Microbacterium sp. TaxID=51671 RepID=UPI003A89ABC0